jgi:hypothetical protein
MWLSGALGILLALFDPERNCIDFQCLAHVAKFMHKFWLAHRLVTFFSGWQPASQKM